MRRYFRRSCSDWDTRGLRLPIVAQEPPSGKSPPARSGRDLGAAFRGFPPLPARPPARRSRRSALLGKMLASRERRTRAPCRGPYDCFAASRQPCPGHLSTGQRPHPREAAAGPCPPARASNVEWPVSGAVSGTTSLRRGGGLAYVLASVLPRPCQPRLMLFASFRACAWGSGALRAAAMACSRPRTLSSMRGTQFSG